MEQVPLKDAIRNLARQADLNYILDPRLYGPWHGPGGASGREPSVSVRWENLTAEQALDRLLKDHGLVAVASPVTSIVRIAFTNQGVKPLPASAIGRGTNTVIPLLVMDSVPLPDAIKNLARQAQLRLELDPALPGPAAGQISRTLAEWEISVRWERVTAQQAVAALLDNYDLALVEDAVAGVARIVAKAQPRAAEPPTDK
jgi:hypothetical protein